MACAQRPTQLLLLLPQTPCMWDRGAHWVRERAASPWHSSSWERDEEQGTGEWTGVRGSQRPAARLCSLPALQGSEGVPGSAGGLTHSGLRDCHPLPAPAQTLRHLVLQKPQESRSGWMLLC